MLVAICDERTAHVHVSVQGPEFKASSSRFRVQEAGGGFGFRVEGFGFRVGLGIHYPYCAQRLNHGLWLDFA